MAMKSYLARVELHYDDDYEQLHELLYDIGYYRTIFLTDDHWHDLPHATYIHHADSSHIAERDLLKQTIASRLKIKPANLATRKEKSFSLAVAESQSDGKAYEVGYILRRANQESVLPPGESLF
jgi:hypothetical protein